jgi:peptidoglycan/LPS O-acetylase OafA/YrhL
MTYLPRLDGLRGVAVLAVMLFHFGYLAPGWIGVQLFFVLSGFLITRILREGQIGSLGARLNRFYWRRSLRILPVMILMLIATALIHAMTGAPASFTRDWPWLVTFLANFGRIGATDLGEAHVHMWSLAVEEQFYLLWPFAALLLSDRAIRRLILSVLILAPLARLVLFQHFSTAGYTPDQAGIAVYVLPFSQFDAFAIGAAIAVWPAQRATQIGRRLLIVFALTGLCGFLTLVWAQLFKDGAFLASMGYPMHMLPAMGYFWGYSLLNLLSAQVVVAASNNHPTTRFLSIRPLNFLGRISYGVYVYHVPMLLLARHFQINNFFVWSAAVIAVATISFYCIEKPILRLKDQFAS